MDNNLNKENIKLVFDKIARLLNEIFPGIFILELFFQKGFFSNPPQTIIEFVLFILWAIILSSPYNFLQPNSISNFMNDFINSACIKFNLDKSFFKEEGNVEVVSTLSEILTLGFIILKIIITYIIFKYITYKFTFYSIFGLSILFEKMFFSIGLTILISYPVGFIYSAIMKKIAIKQFGKTID